MRTWRALGLVLSGLSLWSCSDEKPGPGTSETTSWQVCRKDEEDGSCEVSETAHKASVVNFGVSCEQSTAGLTIRLVDPGQTEANEISGVRRPGTLTISNIRLDDDGVDVTRCIVRVEEETRTGKLRLDDACGESEADRASCRVEGERNSNGWAFDGTLACPGMRINGEGEPDYLVQAAGSTDAEPVVLQIANCN